MAQRDVAAFTKETSPHLTARFRRPVLGRSLVSSRSTSSAPLIFRGFCQIYRSRV